LDFLLTAKRDLDADKRFFRKMPQVVPLLSQDKIGTDSADMFPPAIKCAVDEGLLAPDPGHYVAKHLQQGIESDHFRLKKNSRRLTGSDRSTQPEKPSPALKPCCGSRRASTLPVNGVSRPKRSAGRDLRN
jgi:transposase-like protein